MPEELADLAEMLGEGTVIALRQRVYHRRILRTVLTKFTDRLYFFPIGIQPNLKADIELFINGVNMTENHDFCIRVVGSKLKVAVAVLKNPLSDPRDAVQAKYENVPPPDED